MAAGTFPDAWEEVALVTIQKCGGTAYQFAAITDEVEINEPDYPGESIATDVGGRIWNQKPQEDGEINLTLYPISADIADNTGLFQHMSGSTDAAQPLTSAVTFVAGISKQRDTFMVAMMWTDDTAVTSASGATSTSAKVATRFSCKLARLVSHKASFGPDKPLTIKATFKFPAMNKAGTVRPYKWESTNDCSSVLPALTYATIADL
jgi:hypothetical protein